MKQFGGWSILGLSLSLSLFAANSFAAKISESVFVHSNNKSLLNLIANNPELTVDHPSEFGFELYGPKGVSSWLKSMDVEFSDLTLDHSDHSKIALDDLDYPSYEDHTKKLQELAAKYPKICKLFSIGKSVNGKELWVMKISDNPALDEVEPEFKYISSMHGDEITGRELTMFLIEDMLKAYGSDSKITSLVNNTEIFILPSMNPDGSKLRQRANANGYDLNRNFPDWTKNEPNTLANRQIETQAIMQFQAQRHFSLSANFHGGAVVVNYPWDSSRVLHPLDKLVKDLSLNYADLNPEMRNSRYFNRGITNGADWYVLYGGMQDWSYFWHGDLQVTVELSQSKWPNYRSIPDFYQSNKDSMLAYAEKVHKGAGIKFANKTLSGSVEVINTTSGLNKSLGKFGFFNGEFYKVLEEGEYTFKVKAGNKSVEIDISVEDSIKDNGNYITLN